ncbi:restriction endonuclease subunit S [Castellaniella sp. FW104-7C03]|uniref:restriction endonuclease subunit S n=1 Tax=Castellaniella sp. FW104-7C03 TaxID=3140378 RepID=UPI0033153467
MKHVARFEYGDSLSRDIRSDGDVPVFGSNGVVGSHDVANTLGPAIIVGRKGSYGKVTWTDAPGFCIDTAYYVDSRHTGANLRWLFWVLQTLGLDQNSEDTGVPGLSRESAYRTKVRCPSPQEQQRIANFLDEQTARIDALIAGKVKLLELLDELRYSTVSWAVVGGLHQDREWIATEHEFIPLLPTGWVLGGLTKYIGPIVDYRGKTPEKVDEGILLITARNIRDGRLDYAASAEYIQPEDYGEVMRRGQPGIGDVLFTTEAPLGQVANVDREGIALAQRVIKFRGLPGLLNNYFLKYWLMAHQVQAVLATLATGSTAEGIKASKIGKIPVALPSLEEQEEIVSFLNERVQNIDSAVAHAKAHIEHLEEYRSSLISAAVTGQIDINAFHLEAA